MTVQHEKSKSDEQLALNDLISRIHFHLGELPFYMAQRHEIKLLLEAVLAIESLTSATDKHNPKLKIRRFKELPLGTRFRYLDDDSVYVILERYSTGLVARWDGVDSWAAGQTIFSVADTPEELETMNVVVIE